MTPPERDARSLFRRLLVYRGTTDSAERIEGHEEYLTQVVALVLHENPGLTRELVRVWLDVELGAHEPLWIRPELGYAAPPGFEGLTGVRVDLVIETERHLIFLENKVGAGLGRYVALDQAVTVSQVEVYHRVLERERGGRAGYLLVVCRDPQREYPLPHYRGCRYWWDLYAVVERWRAQGHGDGHAGWLADQLLAFFRETQLDPPRPLRRGPELDRDAARVLAEAARRTKLGNPRMGERALLFDVGATSKTWSVGFRGEQLSIFESGTGARVAPPLDDGFWEADVERQSDVLAGILHGVDELAPAPTARAPLEVVLDKFSAEERGIAERAVEIIRARWGCEPVTGQLRRGSPEITLRNEDGLTIRLGPYAPGRLILVSGARTPALAPRVEALLGRPLPPRQPTQQVNVALRDLGIANIEPLIALFEQRGPGVLPHLSEVAPS